MQPILMRESSVAPVHKASTILTGSEPICQFNIIIVNIYFDKIQYYIIYRHIPVFPLFQAIFNLSLVNKHELDWPKLLTSLKYILT